MNAELVKIWNDAIVAYFSVLSQHSYVPTKTTRDFRQDGR